MSTIPVGYKHTEVGVIPEDWEVTTVGDEFSIQLGKMLDSERNVGVPRPYLGNRAVQWGNIDIAGIGEIRMTPSDLQRYRLRNGDLLVCEGGEIGRAAIWKEPIQECYYQKALHRLRPARSYNVALMLNMLQRWASTGFLLNFVTQTSIAHLPKDKFQKVPLLVPPTKAEQEAIAEALNDSDVLIELLEQLLAKKRFLKQGAMQRMLVPRNGWVSRKLEEIADVIDPHPSHRAPPQIATGIPFVGIGDLNEEGEIIGKKLRNVDESVFEEHRFRYKVQENLIGLGRVASIGKVVKLKDVGVKYAISPTLGVIRGTKVSREYLLHALKSKFVTDQFNRIMSGSTRSSVGMVVLRRLEIPLPSKEEEQTAIATVLSDMDAEIADLEIQVAKNRAVKQGMMQKLLTGEIRLV